MSDFAFKPDPKPSAGGGVGKKKPRSRSHASPKRIAEIREKKCGRCRLCETTVGVQAHHLIPRGIGGSPEGLWTESNIVGLCLACHGLIETRDQAASYLLRQRLTDAEYSYITWKMGEGWAERRYPIRGVDAA